MSLSRGLRQILLPPCFIALFASSALAADPVDCPKIDQGKWNILVRNDFTDLGPFSCTHDIISSQGGTFSGTNNLLTNQDTASADGLIVFDYSLLRNVGQFLRGVSIGPYIQVDDTYQFQPKATQSWNGYTVTPGGFAEFDFTNFLLDKKPGWATDAFRVREGQVIVNTGTTYDSFVGEWIPTYYTEYLRTNMKVPLFYRSWLEYTFTPELVVQYDHWDSGPITPTIFSLHNEALRIGPQVLLIFNFDPKNLPPDWIFLKNWSIQLTNHESWDQDSAKQYTWSAVAVNYTFETPPNYSQMMPHLGVSASFGVGNAELTGNYTKQFKIGLAVKM
jgi:hypothetical protein